MSSVIVMSCCGGSATHKREQTDPSPDLVNKPPPRGGEAGAKVVLLGEMSTGWI